MTDAGTEATLLLLVRKTIKPPGPASPLSAMVPVDWVKPATVEGLQLTDASVGMTTVSVVETWPFMLPVMTAKVCVATPNVLIVKVAMFCPPGTTTDAGTIATALLLVSVTVVPAGLAGPSKVMIPETGFPPATTVGLTFKAESSVARMVSVAVWGVPCNVPVIVAAV